MDVANSIVEYLLCSTEITDLVKQVFKTKKEVTPVKFNGIHVLLHFTKSNTVNLEVLSESKAFDLRPAEKGSPFKQIGSVYKFFKTFGYFDTDYNLFFPNEFIERAKECCEVSVNTRNFYELSLEVNGLIAAFSIETIIEAKNLQDSEFITNGLVCELIKTFDDEYLQFFLREPSLRGVPANLISLAYKPYAAYFIHKNGGAAPTKEYEPLFDKLQDMGLLTAFRKI